MITKLKISARKVNKKSLINLPKISKKSSEKKSQKWWEIEFGKVVPERIVLQFTRQIGAFCGAGVPLLESLELLSKTIKHKRMKSTLKSITDEVRNGESISKAFANYPKIFPQYYPAILESAERNGNLTQSFETLTNYMERDSESKRTIKSALYYPLILIVGAFSAIFILTIYVLPKFELMFSSLNANLPRSTTALLSFSRFIQDYWQLVVSLILLIYLLIRLYIRKPQGRYNFDKFLLRFPVLGKLIKLVMIERFTRILASLVSAGVPLDQALILVEKAIGNQVFKNAISKTSEGIIQGKGFIDPLSETGIFPEETLQIIRVGELSGNLDKQLDYASLYYSKEVEFRLKNISTLIEPLVLIIVGSGVGFVAISLVSAMYGIYSTTTLTG